MAGPASAPGVAPRLAATRVLVAVMAQGRSLKTELAQALPALPDPRDRALVEAICLGVLRRHPAYEAALAQWLQRRLTPRDADLKALLLAGFAQIDALQLPPHAALSATVETCRALGRPSQAGMVNALLRRALREGFPAVAADATWPGWLRRQVRADWGPAAEDVFVASAQPAPMWLRVNPRNGDAAEYRQALAAQQIAAQRVPWLAQALRLDEPVPVAQLPGFAQGQVSVQDGSAQQVADALDLAAGARVLDACAAPGGKSAHLLERDASLRLTALDVDARRLRQVQQTLDRVLPGAQVHLHAADAADLPAWWDGQPFDAVLLDAPCSATGIVRRQPDVLLHRRVHDVETLVALQARLLDALWRTVRPGGQLLYTTCSILACENHAQVEAFLARTPDAAASALPETFGHASGDGRQRLPGEDGCDGFFYARLSKAA